ncbi:hypothetical protein [Armatimonas sp.]|uniref:hypothetical protein n=1 Tax=Armatimonas sp. TaxID=1872638 RepID=UPI00374CD895
MNKFFVFAVTFSCLNGSVWASWSAPSYTFTRAIDPYDPGTVNGYGEHSAVAQSISGSSHGLEAAATQASPAYNPAYGSATGHIEGSVQVEFTWSGGATPSSVQRRDKTTYTIYHDHTGSASGYGMVYSNANAGVDLSTSTHENVNNQTDTSDWETINNPDSTISFGYTIKATVLAAISGLYASAGSNASVSSITEVQ